MDNRVWIIEANKVSYGSLQDQWVESVWWTEDQGKVELARLEALNHGPDVYGRTHYELNWYEVEKSSIE